MWNKRQQRPHSDSSSAPQQNQSQVSNGLPSKLSPCLTKLERAHGNELLSKLSTCPTWIPKFSTILGLEDGSDEVVDGTSRDRTVARGETDKTSAVQCKSVVNLVQLRQRGDARYDRSTRWVSWQPNPADVAEDEPVSMVRVGCVEQQVVPGVEPREYRVFFLTRNEQRRSRKSKAHARVLRPQKKKKKGNEKRSGIGTDN